MSAPVFQIGKPAEIDRLIAAYSDFGLIGRVELMRAVRGGLIGVIEPPREAVVPLRVLEQSTRPQIAIIGDDDYCSTGPTDWPATRRLFRWAKGAMIHATGADAPTYKMAIGMALSYRQFLLIETDTAHMQKWGEALLALKIPFVCLKPTDGVHPRPIEREAIQ